MGRADDGTMGIAEKIALHPSKRAAELPIELRWHGRGGQGAVTASRLLAAGALAAGLYPQSLPDFGAERSGAPVAAHTRIDRAPPIQRGPVEDPAAIVVLDSSLIGQVDLLAGLVSGGAVVLNSELAPRELRARLGRDDVLICTVDGSGIAGRLLRRNLPNSAVLGALLRAVPVVDLEIVAEAVRAELAHTFETGIVDANLAALREGYDTAVIERAGNHDQ